MTLPSSNAIPDKLINAKVYRSGKELLGAATISMPTVEYLTETFSGAGIGGEMELPVMGHTKAMTLGLTFNTPTPTAISLLETEGHSLDIYGSTQWFDSGKGRLEPKSVKLSVNVLPKKFGFGKAEPGKKMDSDIELGLTYLKFWIDGQEMLEIDPANFIFRVRGTDVLATVRRHLGMDN